MSSSRSWSPFAFELQDFPLKLARDIFIAALVIYSTSGSMFKDLTKITAGKGDDASTSLRGASKEDMSSLAASTQPVYPLDEPLAAEQLAFFHAATGIKDSLELKSHICSIQTEAYKSFPYPCIWNFNFLSGKAVNHHLYPHICQVAQQQTKEQQIFVELGSFMGADLRQVVQKARWKRDNVLGVDIVPEWPKLGCKLFNDANNPIPFFLGNILEQNVFDPADAKLIAPGHSTINLRELKDLNPLKRRARFVMINSVFHLFGEETQYQLARCCAALLSTERDSAIFGLQRGEKVKGYYNSNHGKNEGTKLFSHSPESWKELWSNFFKPGEVRIIANLEVLHQNQFVQGDGGDLFLKWSVTRT